MFLQEHSETPVTDEDAVPGPLTIEESDQSNRHPLMQAKEGEAQLLQSILKQRRGTAAIPTGSADVKSRMKRSTEEVGEATHKEAALPLIIRSTTLGFI